MDQNTDNDIVKVHNLPGERPAVSACVCEEQDAEEDWKKKSKCVSKPNTQ